MRLPALSKRWRPLRPRSDPVGPVRRRARQLGERLTGGADELADGTQSFRGLHWYTAALYLAGGAEAALIRPELGRRGEQGGDTLVRVTRWLPLALAPALGAAHAARALRPVPGTLRVARWADGVALAGSAAALGGGAYRLLRRRTEPLGWRRTAAGGMLDWLPILAPLGFASVGVLGLVVSRDEGRDARLHRELARRGQRLDRLSHGRRTRACRIIIRV